MALESSMASLLYTTALDAVNTTANTVNDTTFNTMLGQHNITPNDLEYAFGSMTTTAMDVPVYCDEKWTHFREWFLSIHLVASPIVCVFGLITNILNIIVLTRKDMVSPTNTILTGLAVADMLVMLDYLPFSLQTAYSSFIQTDCARYSYGNALFTLFHAHLSVVCHTVSIGLTLTLAVWRFIAVTFPQNNRDWCNMQRAIIAVVSCYIFTPFFCIPVFLASEIRQNWHNCSGLAMDERGDTDPYNHLYHVQTSEIARRNDMLLQTVNWWVYGVLIKLLPCVVLTVLSVCLIRALYRANERRVQLKSRSVEENNPDRSCDRTTRMLLAVLLLFLITEFPQGILSMMSGFFGEPFFLQCYNNLGEVMDFLALINSAINFILYCVMSRQFRNTFNHLFKPSILNNWIPIAQDTTTQMTTCV